MLEQSAIEEAPDRGVSGGAQRAMRGLEAVLVYALECGEVGGEDAIERGCLGAARRVGRAGGGALNGRTSVGGSR